MEIGPGARRLTAIKLRSARQVHFKLSFWLAGAAAAAGPSLSAALSFLLRSLAPDDTLRRNNLNTVLSSIKPRGGPGTERRTGALFKRGRLLLVEPVGRVFFLTRGRALVRLLGAKFI